MKGLAQPFESLHQVQIIPRGSCFYFLWVFACIFPLDFSKYLHSAFTSRGGIFSEGSLGALTERRALGI